MTTLQIVLAIIGVAGLIIAAVSMLFGRNYSAIIPFSFGGSLFVLALIALVIALIFGGCGQSTQAWHRQIQNNTFAGQCWADVGYGAYEKKIGTVSCTAILIDGKYHLMVAWYGIYDPTVRHSCYLASEAIQVFEHYAAQHDPYKWDSRVRDSLYEANCGGRGRL